jgi:hypothetical protein
MLRPLSVGEILDASFKVYGRNFLTMAKAIVIVAIPFSLLSAFIRASVPFENSSSTTFPDISSNTTNAHSTTAVVASLLVLVVTVVSASVSTAIIYRVVGDAYLGQAPSWRVALGGGLRKANSVLWLEAVTVACFVLIILVPVIVIVIAAQSSTALAVLLGFALGIPLICFFAWFVVGAQLAVPSLMLEDYRGFKALLRGIRLSRHLWWRCFGCLLLIGLIVGILSEVVTGVALVLLLALAHSELSRAAVYFVATVLTTVLFSPITASALVVLSIDLRVRKEGYDIQLLASQLGSQPGSAALSFFPRPPVMWGGPASPWATPGPPTWGPPGPPTWGPRGPTGWQPTTPGWGPPPHQGPPGWVPSPTAPPPGWVGTPSHPPPPPPPPGSESWVPQGQEVPQAPPPLFDPSPHKSPGIPGDSAPTEDTPGPD